MIMAALSTMSHPPSSTSAASPLKSEAQSNSASTTLDSLVLHNLKYQHYWTDLLSHSSTFPSSPQSIKLPLLSGLPPTRIYTHPNAQTAYLKSLSTLRAQLDSLPASSPSDPLGDTPISDGTTTNKDKDTDTENSTNSESPGPERQTQAQDDVHAQKTSSQRTAIESAIADLTAEYERPRREHVAGIWKNAAGGICLREIADVFDRIGVVEKERRSRSDDDRSSTKRFLLAIVDSDSSVVFYVVSDGVVKARQN